MSEIGSDRQHVENNKSPTREFNYLRTQADTYLKAMSDTLASGSMEAMAKAHFHKDIVFDWSGPQRGKGSAALVVPEMQRVHPPPANAAALRKSLRDASKHADMRAGDSASARTSIRCSGVARARGATAWRFCSRRMRVLGQECSARERSASASSTREPR